MCSNKNNLDDTVQLNQDMFRLCSNQKKRSTLLDPSNGSFDHTRTKKYMLDRAWPKQDMFDPSKKNESKEKTLQNYYRNTQSYQSFIHQNVRTIISASLMKYLIILCSACFQRSVYEIQYQDEKSAETLWNLASFDAVF